MSKIILGFIPNIIYKNIMKKIYIYILITGIANGLYLPIWILYLTNCGLSMFQIGILGSLLEGVRFISEVPLGAFSDCFGRKKSIYLSSIFMSLSLFLISFGNINNIFMLISIISMIIMGLGNSFESGAIEAWVSDYLIDNNMENELSHIFIKINTINILGAVIGAIFIMYKYDKYGYLFLIISSSLFLLSFFLSFFSIEEPKYEKKVVSLIKETIAIKNKMIDAVIYLKRSKILIYFCFSTFFYSWSVDGIERFYQVFLEYIGISINKISLVFIISCIVAIILMIVADKLNKLIYNKELYLLIGIRFLMFLSILILTYSNSTGAYIGLIIFLALNYLNNPIMQSFLNSRVSSEIKSTFLSLYELVGSFGEIFSGISIGYLAKMVGLTIGIRVDSLIILISLILIVIYIIIDKICY